MDKNKTVMYKVLIPRKANGSKRIVNILLSRGNWTEVRIFDYIFIFLFKIEFDNERPSRKHYE